LIGSEIKLLNEHVWKELKSMFVWQCFVPILLGFYGNLDIGTVLTYLLAWFFVELVELLSTSNEDFTKTKSWANFFTVLCKILCKMATPQHFFPHSHTLFLEPPVIDNKKLAAIGFDLQDQSSEMTLKCLNILPGNCNSKNTSHHLVSLVMDVWIAALLYLQYSKQKQRQADADAQMQEQMKSLKNAQGANSESLNQLLAEKQQNCALKNLDNLQMIHAALVVCNRLAKYVELATAAW